MTIEEIVARLQAVVDGAEGRDLTDEEATEYADLEAQLAIARRSVEIRARQTAYTTPATPTVEIPSVTPTRDPDAELERAFDHYLRTGIPNQDIQQLRVTGGDVQYRAQNEGAGSAGGYTIPTGFRQIIIERMKAYGGFAPNAQEITTATGQILEWPTLDDTSNQAEIVAEGATFAAGADLVFGIKQLGAYKYMAGGASNAPLKVSYELLQDSAFDVQGLLAKAFATRMGRKQAVDFITGTGTGQPQGLVTPQTVWSSIASTTVPVYSELVNTVHALDPAYRAGAKWLMNDASLGIIRAMVDSQNRPLWEPMAQSGMGEMPAGMLLGYPVIIDQAMPAIATSGSTKWLAFGDFNESYVIRRVRDIQMVVLNELFAANGQVGFMAWARADGTVQDPNAYVVLGSHT